jgi:hypothetical protein
MIFLSPKKEIDSALGFCCGYSTKGWLAGLTEPVQGENKGFLVMDAWYDKVFIVRLAHLLHEL